MKTKKQHEVERKLASVHFDSFAEEHPYPILQLDEQGRVHYANPASLPVLLEWKVEVGEIVGADILKVIKEVVEDDIAQKVKVVHGHTTLELMFSKSTKGGVVNVFGQDISMQMAIQQELLESKKTLEQAESIGRYGSWEWKMKNRTFHCSRGFYRLLNLPQDESITYKGFMGLIVPEDRKALEQAIEASLFSRQEFSRNYRIKLKDGLVRWMRSEGRPTFDSDGKPLKLEATLQDITEKIKGEMELTEATIRADSATRAKAEFLANMSHEIRTPMNGVIGMCNLLLGSVKDPAQLGQLRIIQNCGNSLLNIINDVLDFSKIEAGKIELESEPFNIHETTHEVMQLFGSKADEKGLQLIYQTEASAPQWFLGDSTRFRQILTNLVSNAIKFTSKGSVTISSKARKIESDGRYEVEFAVKDTGIGISKDSQSKLFSSFSQADVSTTRKYGGTGLGLAISKGLCEKMGGMIRLDSEVDKGTTFYFSMVLPRSMGSSVRNSSLFENANINSEATPALSILVAEDNRINQLVIVGILEKMGFHPDVAASGIEVLDSLKRKSYDLIFMDYHMPEMDGLEATQKIREIHPLNKRPYIVALTASAMKQDRDRCLEVGMNDFISKPIQPREINRIINQLISTSNEKGKTK